MHRVGAGEPQEALDQAPYTEPPSHHERAPAPSQGSVGVRLPYPIRRRALRHRTRAGASRKPKREGGREERGRGRSANTSTQRRRRNVPKRRHRNSSMRAPMRRDPLSPTHPPIHPHHTRRCGKTVPQRAVARHLFCLLFFVLSRAASKEKSAAMGRERTRHTQKLTHTQTHYHAKKNSLDNNNNSITGRTEDHREER